MKAAICGKCDTEKGGLVVRLWCGYLTSEGRVLCSLAVTHMPSSPFQWKHPKATADRKWSSSNLELKCHQADLSALGSDSHSLSASFQHLLVSYTKPGQTLPLASSPCCMWMYTEDFKVVFLIFIACNTLAQGSKHHPCGYFKALLSWVMFFHVYFIHWLSCLGTFSLTGFKGKEAWEWDF